MYLIILIIAVSNLISSINAFKTISGRFSLEENAAEESEKKYFEDFFALFDEFERNQRTSDGRARRENSLFDAFAV